MDVLRGFALLGILLMNIQAFSMITAAYINPTAYGDLSGGNYWVWLLCHVFADSKFISIFSMLFGAGVILMWQRAESGGDNPTRRHYRRMGWMILFGLLHAHLLWYGDILYSYGMCGLVVYLFRRQSPRFLVTAALIAGVIGSLVMLAIGLTIPMWPEASLEEFRKDWQPAEDRINTELAAYRGSWLDQMPHRVEESLFFETALFIPLVFWKVASLMLLGMALFKLGAFHALWPRVDYLRLIGAGALIGIPMTVYGVYENFTRNWDIRYSFFIGGEWNYWGSYLVALAWIGVIMIWCQSSLLSRLKFHMGALGRMAFTNYILQTLVCTTIFYGHGLGYFGSIERTGQALIALAIYGIQLWIAPLWLKHFQFGPLEWLWRRLTYGKPQPFIRREAWQQ